jgi:predicted component of type VI protein secretion system
MARAVTVTVTIARSAARVALLLAWLAPAVAAEVSVNRCEVQGRVLYTDQPCAGGQTLTVDGGTAAPDAAARLRRDQRSLDEAAARRRVALAQEDARRRAESERAAALEVERAAWKDAQDSAAAPYGVTYPYGGYVEYRARRPVPRHQPKPPHRERYLTLPRVPPPLAR